jgi:NAD+ kinase
MKTIALYGRNIDANRSEAVQILVTNLEQENFRVLVFEPFLKFISGNITFKNTPGLFSVSADLPQGDLLMISLGGDGTLLETLEFVKDFNLPVMGINTGRLGFLASTAPIEIPRAVSDIKNKRLISEKKTLLEILSPGLFQTPALALNDITLQNKESASMITVDAYFNEQLINSYFADGLIVATPTGSTAYSMSCGGPIVCPGSGVFLITPIAPHNLTVRPLVLPDNGELKFKVEGRTDSFLVSLDSRSAVIGAGTEITIRKSSHTLNLVNPEGYNFFSTLRNKLLWGKDSRN